MNELITGFKEESLAIISELTEILEEIEGNLQKKERLEEFGQKIDRIMGSSNTLVQVVEFSSEEKPVIVQIGKFCELCKTVGYKGSQTKDLQLVQLVNAFLFDAVEILNELISKLGESNANSMDIIPTTFLERLKWISNKFDSSLRGSVAINKPKQK